ncbi:MAG: hypothetical protein JRD89_01185 [Deltaproteobacteria bacterium]|nr:hypothetical protein [Deltaproteobacteria bacterium]
MDDNSEERQVTATGGFTPGPDYEPTPEEYEGPIEYVNWGGYKIAVHGASRLTTEFFDRIAARRKQNRAVIIVVTGPAGEGKSYLAQRFCEIFDKNFEIIDVDEIEEVEEYFRKKIGRPGDPSQVVFDRPHFLFLLGNDSPLEYGQCILADEAQYAMGSRRWYEQLQKDLMEAIESVRSRGYIILIVALHLELLDRIIRKYVLTYMFHVEQRGKAVVYRLYTPRFEKEMRKRRLGILRLQLPSYENCPSPDCLRCNFLYGTNRRGFKGKNPDGIICKTLRARYERRKRHFIGQRSHEAEKRSMGKEAKVKKHTVGELAEKLFPIRDRIQRLRSGKFSAPHVQYILEEEFDVAVSVSRATAVRDRLEILERVKQKEQGEDDQ